MQKPAARTQRQAKDDAPVKRSAMAVTTALVKRLPKRPLIAAPGQRAGSESSQG